MCRQAAAVAALQGWLFKPARTHDGFVIEPGAGSAAWRLEWGPSHRAYLGRRELRLRGSVPLDLGAHAVVLPRPLMAALDREVYSALTDAVQTRMDEALPEEVRWLAVSPRLTAQALGAWRDLLGAATNVQPWVQAWLAGRTGALLARLLQADTPAPLALTLHQGVLTLRLGMARPEPERLPELVEVFEAVWAEAVQRAQGLGLDGGRPGDPPSETAVMPLG